MKSFPLFFLLCFEVCSLSAFCQSLTWERIASNVSAAGSVVGSGSFLTVDGAATGAVTIGTAYIYTSFNQGRTWSSTASIQWNNNTSGLNANGNGMYFGSGVLFCITNASNRNSGVFRSIDSGRTFTELSGLGTASTSIIYPVRAVWGYGSVVFVTYSFSPNISTLYRSSDRGATWTPINTPYSFTDFTRSCLQIKE
jgi:hypothetical protein